MTSQDQRQPVTQRGHLVSPRYGGVCTSGVGTDEVGDRRTRSESRQVPLELSRLAVERDALRGVATLAVGQATPEVLLAKVAEVVARLLRAEHGIVCRYERDGSTTAAACWTATGDCPLPDGKGVELADGVAGLVLRSGQPVRIDSREDRSGPEPQNRPGRRSTVGAPILADGRVWGIILATLRGPEGFPEDAESRLAGFAELVAAVISNALDRAELNASRARIVAAADEVRRRVGRDLHDGAQQRLATLAMQLRAAAGQASAGAEELREELAQAANDVTDALNDVREIAHGIHPAILSTGGLDHALRALARRSAIPVVLRILATGRIAEHIEIAAYYVVCELLANAVKHANASLVCVTVEQASGTLHVTVHDDGIGGADPARGSGLIGLRDRVGAIGGAIRIDSPSAGGTRVDVSLPIR